MGHAIRLAVLLALACAACAPTPTPIIVTATPTASPAPPATVAPTVTMQPAALPTWTPVPTPVPGTLFVDASTDLGPISPLVYGTNYGPWVAVPFDLKPQAVAAHLTYLRFPGGNWGDENDLQTYQVDQYITLARDLGAEPNICVRLYGGTPEKAAYWVRYANVDHQYGVRYWSIGNEPTLYASVHQTEYDTERFNREWRAMALAMRAVDPTIKLIGPDPHGSFTDNAAANPKDAQGRDWMEEFLKANGDLVDIVSIHRYAFPPNANSGPPTIDDLRHNTAEWDRIIPYLRGLIRETTGRDLPVAVTEVNSNWSNQCCGEATPDSHYNAIWWTDVLGRLIRERVDIVAHFVIQSPPGGAGGALGLLANYEVRPTFYVYMLYQRFGTELLYASSDDPDVSIYAARRDDGALTLLIVNLGPARVDKTLRLERFNPGADAETWLFDAQHNVEQVAPTPLGPVTTLHLPAQSATLLVAH